MKLPVARCLFLLAMLIHPTAWSEVLVSINVAPPILPVYEQPVVPGDGYLWAPGYWAWNADDRDYYWVPGTWVMAPGIGQLWTPGYWEFADNGYFWHGGYWGTTVGYYGGINYGYGYAGSGYQGGRWDHGTFQYNRAVSHIDSNHVHAIYSAPVAKSAGSKHTSFSKGTKESHERNARAAGGAGPTPEQLQHEHAAMAMPAQRASLSHGSPPVRATTKPSAFEAPRAEAPKSDNMPHAQAERPATREAPEKRSMSAGGPPERAGSREEPQRVER